MGIVSLTTSENQHLNLSLVRNHESCENYKILSKTKQNTTKFTFLVDKNKLCTNYNTMQHKIKMEQ